MEVSTKQAGAKRFDDPGIAAALVGDADVDGPGGALEVVKCGKLEPKVTSVVVRVLNYAHGVFVVRLDLWHLEFAGQQDSCRITKVPLAD